MAWEHANGPVPAGLLVCHKCDNRLCCNPAHLFLGTSADNNADMVAKGRQARGERITRNRTPNPLYGEAHPLAKLSENQVREIRRRVDAGEEKLSMAREFGVSEASIRLIGKRKNWSHLSE